jgi:hypothetical protein
MAWAVRAHAYLRVLLLEFLAVVAADREVHARLRLGIQRLRQAAKADMRRGGERLLWFITNEQQNVHNRLCGRSRQIK